MSNNKLLNENTVRRFMKLAKVETLTSNFINEMYAAPPAMADEEDRMEDLEEGGEAEVLDQQTDDELIAAMLADEEGSAEPMAEVADEEAIHEVNWLFEQEEEMEMDMDMEEDPEMDAEMEAPAAAEDAEMDPGADVSLTEEEAQLLITLGERLKEAMDAEDEMPAAEEPAAEEPMAPEAEDEPATDEEEDIVQEVLRRVTKRLVSEKLKASK